MERAVHRDDDRRRGGQLRLVHRGGRADGPVGVPVRVCRAAQQAAGDRLHRQQHGGVVVPGAGQRTGQQRCGLPVPAEQPVGERAAHHRLQPQLGGVRRQPVEELLQHGAAGVHPAGADLGVGQQHHQPPPLGLVPVAGRRRVPAAARPAARPAVRPAARLAVSGAARAAARVAVRAAGRLAARPALSGAARAAARVTVRAAVRAAGRPAARPALSGAARAAARVPVRAAARPAVRGAVRVTVRAAVRAAGRPAVRAAVRITVRAAVRVTVRAAVRAAGRLAASPAVRAAVRAAVRITVRVAVRDQLQRLAQPARRGVRRGGQDLPGGADQGLGRVGVAGLCGTGQVRGPGDHMRAAVEQRGRRPGVQGEPLPGADLVVGDAAQQRVAQPQPARLGRLHPDQVALGQHVKRVQHLGERALHQGGHQRRVERVSGHRGGAQHGQLRGWYGGQLGADRGRHRGRDPVGGGRVDRLRRVRRAGQGQRVERVAAAGRVQPARLRPSDAGQRADVGHPERGQVQPLPEQRRPARGEDLGRPRGHLARPVRHRNQQRHGRRMPQQELQQLQRRTVGPVQVVEEQRPATRLGAEPVAYLAVEPEPLHIRLGADILAGEPAERLEQPGEDRERHLPLELRRAAGDHRQAGLGGHLLGLAQQPALADPRVPDQFQHASAPATYRVHAGTDARHLALPADQTGATQTTYVRHDHPTHEVRPRTPRSADRPTPLRRSVTPYRGGAETPRAIARRSGHRHAPTLPPPVIVADKPRSRPPQLGDDHRHRPRTGPLPPCRRNWPTSPHPTQIVRTRPPPDNPPP